MSQVLLQNLSREIADRAEESFVPTPEFGRWMDDYFVERLKQDELACSDENARLYDALREGLKTGLLPRYTAYLDTVERIRERKSRRGLGRYVLGTVAAMAVVEALVTRGRSLVPAAFLLSAVASALLGLLIYAGVQYVDDRQLARARRRLERSIQELGRKLQTDLDYDRRRGALDGTVLQAEVLEVLARYAEPDRFWEDYRRVRQADPTTPVEVAQLGVPALASFLKPQIEGQLSSVARMDRYNRLFLAAHEAFVGRDREGYALRHLGAPPAADRMILP